MRLRFGNPYASNSFFLYSCFFSPFFFLFCPAFFSVFSFNRDEYFSWIFPLDLEPRSALQHAVGSVVLLSNKTKKLAYCNVVVSISARG